MDERVERLEVIKGTVPSPLNLPSGCLFKRRCPYRMRVCDTAPPYQEISPGHFSRCWLTPAGEAPAVGADAEGEEAEAAAERARRWKPDDRAGDAIHDHRRHGRHR